MATNERRSVGAPFHDLGTQLDQPTPESPTSVLQREQARSDEARRADLERAVASKEAEREANRISGV